MLSDSDEEFIEEEEEQSPAAIKKLREKLAEAVKEKQEYLDGWQRTRADFVNFKKEEAAMLEEKELRIKAELAEAIIPTLDSFEMAFSSPSFEKADTEWQKGIKGLYTQLLGSLSKLEIEQFGKVDEPYDHYKHEALAQQGDGEKVVSVQRSGYKVGEKIIRPAQVII